MTIKKNKKQSSILVKPEVLKKMSRYIKKSKKNEFALQLVELNYDNTCNFKCEHCFSKYFVQDEKRIGIMDVKKLAEQADMLGAWQWHFQGGEPLMWDELDDLIAVIGPEKFHIMITTNGYFLDENKALHLKEIGVDKISVSIDSLSHDEHDKFRNKPGALEKALHALENAQKVGMQTNINTVITHQNVKSQGVLDILEFSKRMNYSVLLVVATASGKWAGKTDMLIDNDDSKYLLELKRSYPFVHRDLYQLFDFKCGCRTMNGLVYITPNGDLLSCPFIHIKIGNILDEKLKDILERGWRVKHFRDYSEICLAGENMEFIKRYMSKIPKGGQPIAFEDAFEIEDLYEKIEI